MSPTPPLSAAYGGTGWSPRIATHAEEIGTLWSACGIDTEWQPLRAVLLHTPGAEIESVPDPNAAQMLTRPNWARARAQHTALAETYRAAGVQVHQVNPAQTPPPNLMFCADLLFMTPAGAILARPASTVRAGEERFIAQRLAALGIPIIRTLTGKGVFEGADAMWINPKLVLLGRGLRTNALALAQITATLHWLGVQSIILDLPYGTMHLMGQLRLFDHNLAIAWQTRLAVFAVEQLRQHGYTVHCLPDETEARVGHALNVVTLAPRHILMPAGNPITQAFYESLGVTCETVAVDELLKAAGGIACLTGVLERERGVGNSLR